MAQDILKLCGISRESQDASQKGEIEVIKQRYRLDQREGANKVWVDRYVKPWGLLAGGALAGAGLLSGCGIAGMAGPYPGVHDVVSASSLPKPSGPVAAPQVGYRIDEKRYFEIVPLGTAACSNADIYYVDQAQGIRSRVLDTWELGGVDLVIDAANEQYLVAPITRGNTDCSSGGGFCGGSKLPYSIDGGRTWKRATPRFTSGYEVHLIGQEAFYAGQKVNLSDLARGDESAWTRYYLVGGNVLPPMARRPLDAKFHCTPNGKE